ncbi:MAG: hypothetical protein IJA97_04945 [Clostridia bacterium]|nr:hypothetical protein [Clostridia bacterium]
MIEKELIKRNLPSLFGGEENVSVKRWEEVFKPKWRDLLLKEEYGYFPPIIEPKIKAELNPETFSGKATWEEVTFTFERNGKSHSVKTNLIFPKRKTNLPFFIFLNFRPSVPDKYLPIDKIIDNGFGIFSVCYKDVTDDNDDFSSGLSALFASETRKDSEFGKIVIWAYMTMRMMDYLQTRPEVDKDKIGVIGHSRLGKTALVAGAYDERFSFVCANDSGCSGASLSRGRYEWSEKLTHVTKTFPFWFCRNYLKYADNEDKLPFDQHALLSLIAPRSVYVGGAIEDTWADNDNQFLCCYESSKVWKLYGKRGLVCSGGMPVECDAFTSGEVGFFLRSGKHALELTDWDEYIKAIKEKFN